MVPLTLDTLWTLLLDPNHWVFELLVEAVSGGLVGAIVWPWVRRHIHRDVKTAEEHDHELIRLLTERVQALESSTGVPGQTLTAVAARRLAAAKDIAAQTGWCHPDFARGYAYRPSESVVLGPETEEADHAEP